MGEIDEALRRARQDRSPDVSTSPAARRTRKPADDVYSSSAERHEQENPPPEPPPEPVEHEPCPPAPPPGPAAGESAPAGKASAAPVATAHAPAEAIALTNVGEEAKAPQGVLTDDGGAVTDACLQLALRVRKAMMDRDAKSLVVVSALRNEGKTTVSCNLALALASLGQVARVALVDLDLRRPSLETVLELSTPTVGIADVLLGRAPLSAARVPVASPRLDVYPCLRGQTKAHELLLDPRFEEVLEELNESYDVIVFDSPPSLLVPDATIIMQHVDCFVPVARAGVTRARNFKKMLDMLPRQRMLGGVLDGGSMAARKGYYQHYGPDEVEDLPEAEAHEIAEVAHGG